MSPSLKTRGDDGIQAGVPKYCRLVGCCRRANRNDALRPALVQDLRRRNAADEAECRHVGIQQHASLIFESDR
jgi:hypothetical protein